MNVHNKTKQPIIVFGWNAEGGHGEEKVIHPGESWNVKGPYIGMKNGRQQRLAIPGKVTIQEKPCGESNYRRQLLKDGPWLVIDSRKNPKLGVSVKYLDQEDKKKLKKEM